ncbi:NACHT, LRR and PYD domains-containing protein 12-like, partial [Clarias magur]
KLQGKSCISMKSARSMNSPLCFKDAGSLNGHSSEKKASDRRVKIIITDTG